MIKKIDFILKYCQFTIDYGNKFICSDKNILGHYNSHSTTGESKEDAALEMVKLYDEAVKKTGDSYAKKDFWALGWSLADDTVEISPIRLKEICLSIIADNTNWLKQQVDLAPIGRDYYFREVFATHFWFDFYQRHEPSSQFKKESVNYQELLKAIRALNTDESFEFSGYNKQDCIREGFFIKYSQKNLDELKDLIKSLRQH